MKYCRLCLQPDTRPNSVFTDEGICPACNYSEQLKDVDWHDRYEELQSIVSSHRSSSKTRHDCIIGVSGGKDSTRQALWIRDNLGLNPLLVCLAYPPQQVSQRGVDNLSNLINLGFDVLTLSLAPLTWKKLLKIGFDHFTNWAKTTELALYASVPRIASIYNIQLIFWGENPGLQVGDLKTLGKNGYDGNNLRNMNTLSGGQIDWLVDLGIDPSSLISYNYPDIETFEEKKLQIIYLGWFLRDWSLINNGMYSACQGLDVRTDGPENTGDLYGLTALDEDWVTLNQMIKYYKFGFGRASDYVNEEIRLGRLSRSEGIPLLEKYDGCCSNIYIDSFCDYIDITRDYFWDKVKKSLNTSLFDIKSDGSIVPKFVIGEGI